MPRNSSALTGSTVFGFSSSARSCVAAGPPDLLCVRLPEPRAARLQHSTAIRLPATTNDFHIRIMRTSLVIGLLPGDSFPVRVGSDERIPRFELCCQLRHGFPGGQEH